jgi:hypothetical protein
MQLLLGAGCSGLARIQAQLVCAETLRTYAGVWCYYTIAAHVCSGYRVLPAQGVHEHSQQTCECVCTV